MTGPRIIEEEDEAPRRPEEAAKRPRVLEEQETGRMAIEVAPAEAPPLPPPPPAPRRASFRLAAWSLLLLLVSVAMMDAWRFVERQLDYGLGAGLLAAALVAIGFGVPFAWLLHEMRGLRRLRAVERVQSAIALGSAHERARAERLLARTRAALPHTPELVLAAEELDSRIQPHHSGEDLLYIARTTLMVPCDAAATAAVRRAAAQMFGLAAISPTALTDTVLFLARALRLLREVAEAYGQRPGAAGVVHLIKRIVREAGMLGAAELTAQAAAEFGGSALEKAGLAAATSTLAAWRMARFGLLAMRACRPIPFTREETPSLPDLVTRRVTQSRDT